MAKRSAVKKAWDDALAQPNAARSLLNKAGLGRSVSRALGGACVLRVRPEGRQFEGDAAVLSVTSGDAGGNARSC